MSGRKTPGLEAQHDTQLVAVIIDEPDGNSVVGKKWNQNQSDLTTASRFTVNKKLLSNCDTNFSQKLRIIFSDNHHHNHYRY